MRSVVGDRRAHRRRIARPRVGRGPQDFSGFRFERDDARLGPANIGNDAAILDEGRARGAEESFRHLEALHRVNGPDPGALRKVDRMQLPFGTEV